MKAVRNAPPTVEVVDVDEPDGDGELVRVAAAGICASDFKYLQYGSTQIAGQEFAGALEDGTAVAVEGFFGCGKCTQCQQGALHMCTAGPPTAPGMLSPGGMSEWFRAPRHVLVPLPPDLDVADAALVEPASVAWHSCHRAEVTDQTRVAIVGAGAIGVLAAAAAQQMGAPEVAVAARHAHQHEAREGIGAVVPTADYDVVIETGGSESALHRAVELSRPGGTVVHLGAYPAETVWPMEASFSKEVTVRPSLGYCSHGRRRDFAEAADLLAARPELVRTLITHRFPIDDAVEAFRVAQDKSKGVFRVVIQP
ncbi:alcohol dehydrogenase catalytic domain-containing protein [Mycobacterium sp. 1164985.4]|uniref:zinc-dependent alcohol dehydrogenase n=1 Tax=Mycobacterium sp. 1164985.4 TaxID=1834069 RepID=UPI0007FC6FD9|nr:alcohol dehydrogenase catalytic domain-containing protein [Mycobacterium sp. 1164985.4]OBK76599.1 alcohol dehydrogenase [Mycobacterium sp. 1164985.4]